MTTIFERWQSYRRIIPDGAPALQVEEVRRAFYAGATALFGLVIEASAPADEDECEQNMENLDNELTMFSQDLRVDR